MEGLGPRGPPAGPGGEQGHSARLAEISGEREKYTIVTKGGHYSLDTGAKRVNAAALRADMEHSLRALGLSEVDIYFVHNDDEATPVSEVMPELHKLVREGKTRVIGASNWSTRRIAQAKGRPRQHPGGAHHLAAGLFPEPCAPAGPRPA